MINIFELYRTLLGNVNPSQNGHIRPQENFTRWCNEIQHELQDELIRKFESNQSISDKLAPFLVSVNAPLTPQPGKAYDLSPYPQDYRGFASARVLLSSEEAITGAPCATCCMIDEVEDGQRRYQDPDDQQLAGIAAGSEMLEVPITKVDNQRWGAAMRHLIKGPKANKPLLTAYDGGFKVAPRGLGIIVLDYFRVPKDCVFDYVVGLDGQIIFNPVTSDHLEWNSNMIPDFLARLQSRYGVYVREEFAYQTGEVKRNQTKA